LTVALVCEKHVDENDSQRLSVHAGYFTFGCF